MNILFGFLKDILRQFNIAKVIVYYGCGQYFDICASKGIRRPNIEVFRIVLSSDYNV